MFCWISSTPTAGFNSRHCLALWLHLPWLSELCPHFYWYTLWKMMPHQTSTPYSWLQTHSKRQCRRWKMMPYETWSPYSWQQRHSSNVCFQDLHLRSLGTYCGGSRLLLDRVHHELICAVACSCNTQIKCSYMQLNMCQKMTQSKSIS